VANPLLYDLVINTEKLTLEAAADLIITAMNSLPAAG
jgi:cytidylate kinase